jgi:hypothetical protein
VFLAVFSTRTKNKVEKHISCFIGHKVLFYETTFSEYALSATHATSEAADWLRQREGQLVQLSYAVFFLLHCWRKKESGVGYIFA